MVRLISRQHGSLAALKLTKLFGINNFLAAKDSGKVLIIIIYYYLIIVIIRFVSNFPRAVQLCQLRWKLLAYIIDVVKEAKKLCLFSGATKALD